MSTPNETSIIMLGLVGAGKTNFLAALDVLLDRQSDSDGLRHAALAPDRVYLQPIREKWLRGESLDRTRKASPDSNLHSMLIVHPSSGQQATVYVPDLAGETFDSMFITRSIPKDLCTRLACATGFLLFLHPGRSSDHTVLEDPWFVEACAADEAQRPSPAWRIEDAALQTKVVDLLQFIEELGRGGGRPKRVAVVVSAWDLLERAPPSRTAAAEAPKDPLRYLERCWPLLEQYLRAKSAAFECRVFGVSARGGGEAPEDVARLVGYDDPTERLIMVDSSHRSRDISRPVRWLLRLLG